jgi:hypothetical protein
MMQNAILAFESEVQRFPDSVDGWRLLGQCNADNENDGQCIAALSRAVALDQHNLEAMLMMAVSLTNDLDHVCCYTSYLAHTIVQIGALTLLKSWLANHPEFQSIHHGQISEGSLHDDVTKLFLEASNHRPHHAGIHVSITLTIKSI